jgi:phage pi2 protein 07
MKDVLVTIIKKSLGIDWLEMSMRSWIASSILDCDRFDPVNSVLQNKSAGARGQFYYNLMRQHRIRWRGADVKKKRSISSQQSSNLRRPSAAPIQIRLSILAVGKFAVPNSQIVGWRGHHKIDTFTSQTRHSLNAILLMKVESSH